MKYTIETTDTGCIETLETNNGTFSTEWKEIVFGQYQSQGETLVDQMEAAGFDDAALDIAYELHDGSYELDFMRLAKAAELF